MLLYHTDITLMILYLNSASLLDIGIFSILQYFTLYRLCIADTLLSIHTATVMVSFPINLTEC